MSLKSNRKYVQGMYTPINPEKYVGDISKIRYMSSWEANTHKFFDQNPNVLRWSSEGIAIPYVSPLDGRVHKYLVDYWIEYVDKDGNVHQELVEVKPLAQTKRPRSSSNSVYEAAQYMVNQAKWEAAVKFAETRNMKFRVLTEKSIFK